jgi:hypothetical protein
MKGGIRPDRRAPKIRSKKQQRRQAEETAEREHNLQTCQAEGPKAFLQTYQAEGPKAKQQQVRSRELDVETFRRYALTRDKSTLCEIVSEPEIVMVAGLPRLSLAESRTCLGSSQGLQSRLLSSRCRNKERLTRKFKSHKLVLLLMEATGRQATPTPTRRKSVDTVLKGVRRANSSRHASA